MEPALAPPHRGAVTRWSGRLVDPAQERRYRASRLPVLRRDVQVVAAAVLLYNAWSVVEAFATAPTAGRGALDALNNAVMIVGASALVVFVRRARTWTATAATAVAAVAAYTVVSVTGTFGGDTAPQVAVGVTLVTAAVLYLHAQLPVTWTAALGLGWSIVGAAAMGWSVLHRAELFPVAQRVSWDFLVEVLVLLLVINAVGLVSTHRGATNERLLFAEQEAVRRLSQTDPLTGLANRRWWEGSATAAWERCAAEGEPLGLVLVDVDGFKGVNDRFGHAGGDDVLRRVAALLADRAVGPGEVAARLGGDEFALLLPGTGRAAALEVAASVLDAARSLRGSSSPDDPCSRLGLSIGAAVERPGAPGGASSWEGLVTAVDALLYAAKATGRDRVVSSADELPPAPAPA